MAGTHSSASLPHQVGSPPQKVESYQAEFSMSLLRSYHHHSTDVIRDECIIFLYMSSTHLPSSSFKKKWHPDTLLQCWPIITSGVVSGQKSRLKTPEKNKRKIKKIQSSGTTAPCFGGMTWWFGWYGNHTHFFGYKREKKWWVSTKNDGNIHINHIDNIK